MGVTSKWFYIELQQWMSSPPNEHLHLPAANVFIPTDLSLKDPKDKVIWVFKLIMFDYKLYAKASRSFKIIYLWSSETGHVPDPVKDIAIFEIMVQAWYNVFHPEGLCENIF